MATRETASKRRRRYEAKRKIGATPEPAWKTRKTKKTRAGRLYVIHKHAARRLHYDLRLEIEGALASWAVPKGIPLNPGEKHLAIKVEDHPLDYGDFEGNIPPGNYGAGVVMLWDRGLYEVLEKNPAEAVDKGHLSLVLAGEKLRGEWHLVRTRSQDAKEQWLLLKGKGNELKLSPKDEDRSVASGRSLAQIAGEKPEPESGKKPAKRKNFAKRAALKNLPLETPKFATPMKPHLSAGLPRHGDWIYEIKFDGYRVVAVKDEDATNLYSQNHKDVSRDFSGIRDAVAALPVDKVVLDGEAVALLNSGVSSFQLLQNRARSKGGKRPYIFFYALDLINLEGRNTTALPLSRRKQLLEELLAGQPDPLRYSAAIGADPEAFLSQAKKLGLEGLVAKRTDSRYEPARRSRSWLKIKLHHQQEFVIGGYTPPKGTRSRFGAILAGVYEGNDLRYVGRVGTGFDEKMLEKAYQTFQPLRTSRCPFVNLPTSRKSSFGGVLTGSEMKRCVWLEPKLVCEVRFSEWTDEDSIRQPVFLGFRDDKRPHEVKRETPVYVRSRALKSVEP